MCISIYISILYEQGLFIYDHLRVRVYAVYACNTYSDYTYIHTCYCHCIIINVHMYVSVGI